VHWCVKGLCDFRITELCMPGDSARVWYDQFVTGLQVSWTNCPGRRPGWTRTGAIKLGSFRPNAIIPVKCREIFLMTTKRWDLIRLCSAEYAAAFIFVGSLVVCFHRVTRRFSCAVVIEHLRRATICKTFVNSCTINSTWERKSWTTETFFENESHRAFPRTVIICNNDFQRNIGSFFN